MLSDRYIQVADGNMTRTRLCSFPAYFGLSLTLCVRRYGRGLAEKNIEFRQFYIVDRKTDFQAVFLEMLV